MLKNNIVTITPATVGAVNYAEYTLTLSMLKDNKSRLEKKLKNETNVKIIDGLKAELAQVDLDIKGYTTLAAEVKDAYNATVTAMTAKNEKGFSNSETAVKNIINLIAAAKNSKLEKYALQAQTWDNSLANAFDTIHLLSDSNEFGEVKKTKAVKASYQNAADLIDRTLREAFSLPIATEANSAFRCKFDKTTLKMLHEAYITGLSNKYNSKKDDEDFLEFNSTKMRALISSKKSKDGKVTYNYNKFNTVIAKLVIAKIAQA